MRRDLHARQLDNGRYVSLRQPLRPSHLIAHLRGELTLGTYLLDKASHGRFLVLDADDEPDWRRLKALARVLAEQEAPGYLEHSRRGGHLWFFLDGRLPGHEIRAFGLGLCAYFHIEGIELFPKQSQLQTGPGSLIRLPFGVHHKSGRRYGFYTLDDQLLAPTLREQIQIYERPKRSQTPLSSTSALWLQRQFASAIWRH